MNKEIEFCTIKSTDCIYDERFVFCRVKPRNKFLAVFTPWKQMWRAYDYVPSRTFGFNVDDYKLLKESVRTEEDIKGWFDKQREKIRKNQKNIDGHWDEV